MQHKTIKYRYSYFISVFFTPLALITISIFFIFGAIGKLTNSSHLVKIAISFDRISSTIWYGTGKYTVSHNIGIKKKSGKMNIAEKVICKVLDFWDSKHCINAIGV